MSRMKSRPVSGASVPSVVMVASAPICFAPERRSSGYVPNPRLCAKSLGNSLGNRTRRAAKPRRKGAWKIRALSCFRRRLEYVLAGAGSGNEILMSLPNSVIDGRPIREMKHSLS
jgi:hypothetical protein